MPKFLLKATRCGSVQPLMLALITMNLMSLPAQAGSKNILTLERAIHKAVQYSPALSAAQADVEAAKGGEEQAGYWPNPQIGIEVENIGGTGEFSGFDAAESTIGISQTVERTAKRQARLAAAKAERTIQENTLPLVRLNLQRDVALAYFETLATHHQVMLATEERKLAKKILTTVTKRVNAARDPLIQQKKASVRYANSQLQYDATVRSWETAKLKLANYWGADRIAKDLQHETFTAVKEPQEWSYYKERLESDAPDLRPFNDLTNSNRAILTYEKVALLPDPNFSVSIRDFRGSSDQAFVVGVSLPIPVLNTNQGKIRQASANLAKVSSSRQLVSQQITAQSQELWQTWQTANAEIEQLQNIILPTAKQALALAQTGYERGKFSYLEVLDAQRTLFDSKTNYHDSLLRAHTARTNLHRLIRQPETEKTDE